MDGPFGDNLNCTICTAITFLTSFWLGDSIFLVRGRERDMSPVEEMVLVCVHVFVEITEVCRITINNPHPLTAQKERREGGRKGIRE